MAALTRAIDTLTFRSRSGKPAVHAAVQLPNVNWCFPHQRLGEKLVHAQQWHFWAKLRSRELCRCVTRRAESFCEHLWNTNAVWKRVGLFDFCQTCGEFWLPGELPVRHGAESGHAESRSAGISASLSAYLLRGRRAAEGSRRARQPPEDPWQSTSTPRTRHEGWLDVRRAPFGLRWPIAVRAVTP